MGERFKLASGDTLNESLRAKRLRMAGNLFWTLTGRPDAIADPLARTRDRTLSTPNRLLTLAHHLQTPAVHAKSVWKPLKPSTVRVLTLAVHPKSVRYALQTRALHVLALANRPRTLADHAWSVGDRIQMVADRLQAVADRLQTLRNHRQAAA